MNLKSFIAGTCMVMSAMLSADSQLITRDGKALYTIVHNKADGAALELKLHLDKMSGANFEVTDESEFDGKNSAIFVGKTSFAAKNGVDFTKFGPEQWEYKTIGKNLVIGGGNWNGDKIAVWKFLENELGCHWFTFESEYIPKMGEIKIPDLNRTGTPAFEGRHILFPYWVNESAVLKQKMLLTIQRNRGNPYNAPKRPSGSYINNHSFYVFVSPEKYFKTHPEYFSMNADGQRFHGDSKERRRGQLCLTNPEVADVASETLREIIKKDRAANPPDRWPTVYEISQLDNSGFMCLCPKCKNLAEAEGSESALVLTFINRIALNIRQEYPEIYIKTFAYGSTEKAPKSMKPEQNVIIMWCDLYSRSDCFKPLTHKVNAEQMKCLEKWGAIGAHLSIWDYWNMGESFFNPPRLETMVDAIGPTLHYLKKIGVTDYLAEAQAPLFSEPPNFVDLQHWLGYQLLDNLEVDEEKLIDTYMKYHYGPAAAQMNEFLSLLRNSIRNETKPCFYLPGLRHDYQTPEFVQKAYGLLAKARALTPPDSPYRVRVEKEMIAPLGIMLRYPALRGARTREEVFSEYRDCRENQIKAYYPPEDGAKILKKLEKEYSLLMFDFATPEKFKDVPPEKLFKFAWPSFNRGVENDPDSPLGKTVKMGSTNPESDQKLYKMEKVHELYPTTFALHDYVLKKWTAFAITKPPQDEKYHWYKFEPFQFGPNTKFLGWWSWSIADISSVYRNVDGVEDANIWTVWFSAKITGPWAVKDSKKPNGIYVDQIILVGQ